MSNHSSWVVYSIFGLVIIGMLLYDLGIFKPSKDLTSSKQIIRSSIIKTIVWILAGLLFSIYIFYERGKVQTLEYVTAFLMEWSLSVDNVFVFILLFSGFNLNKKAIDKTLLIGVVLAIIFRIIFIAIGISVIEKFHWLFYIFSVFLVYTGIKIFLSKEDDKNEIQESKTSKWLSKWLRTKSVNTYKLIIKIDGKWYSTTVLLTIILIAITDITFALDSIPAVLAITQDTLIIYTSNIFAVLGLRSLFFALQGAKDKFIYLPKGIALVLVFVGVKIFLAEYFKFHISTLWSLAFIVLVFGGSIFISTLIKKTH